MKNGAKILFLLVTIVLVAYVFIHSSIIKSSQIAQYKKINQDVTNYANTTIDRLKKGLVTLPKWNTLVGLDNTNNLFTAPDGTKGTVVLDSSNMQTKFVPGVMNQTQPRMDALVPMSVTNDVNGGSTYIVLYWDRGDATIEKSYARLGGTNVTVQKITTMPAQTPNQEYIADIVFTQKGGTQKETLIPIIDGKFDPTGTITK